ncbi:unnamed protein product [Bursaphelenchus xylophilus]|uniref:Inhibitor of growth protein n=1 Tax=Bursaphelenchus xylophilus TaxID=6326 RepID=A0A1I7S3N9_BURXY|nr:unnamed protein product [Bursaphelenchus xylophilus]CAG9116435.1 unnamed protein product [Bursaphelenchus xylophilus]
MSRKKIKKPVNDIEKLRSFTKQFKDVTAPIRSNLMKIQELDKECAIKQKFIENFTGPILQTWHTTNKDRRIKRYKKLKNVLTQLEQLSSEKVKLATKNYETLDYYVDELDKTYAKITTERAEASSGPSRRRRDIKVEEIEKFDPTTVVDMPVDPDEPTYCLCNQVSFGQMVMCDNRTCLTEWFHFDCVGLTSTPTGKWFCPNCKE